RNFEARPEEGGDGSKSGSPGGPIGCGALSQKGPGPGGWRLLVGRPGAGGGSGSGIHEGRNHAPRQGESQGGRRRVLESLRVAARVERRSLDRVKYYFPAI